MSGVQALECCCHYVGTLFYRPFDSRIGPQILRPNQDVGTTGSWAANPAPTAPLFPKINEVVADDFVGVVNSLVIGVGTNTYLAGFTNPTTTPDGSQVHRLSTRVISTTSAAQTIRVQLKQGATVVADSGVQSVPLNPAPWKDIVMTLTAGEKALITDYNNLTVLFTHNNPVASNHAISITWCQFEC